MKEKLSEALLVKDLRPTISKKEKSVPLKLKLFNQSYLLN